jgi:hypothetical protein
MRRDVFDTDILDPPRSLNYNNPRRNCPKCRKNRSVAQFVADPHAFRDSDRGGPFLEHCYMCRGGR